MPTKLLLGPSEEQELNISVRPLYLDTKLKEYPTGPAHDITDRDRPRFRHSPRLSRQLLATNRIVCAALAGSVGTRSNLKRITGELPDNTWAAAPATKAPPRHLCTARR